ncbi:D-TA family PLP-dependent enzyme [Mucilaginibacter boryungensis]|uniref:D-TA family PLP-dependent enzyme n=1 Tax=Mucilaginibacter boryungensis TaxID=768480 RepID=A0ABR9XFI0_9SPHI|nr:D-TA family PLP-dependent enzyme [Mucilaginibacter boryungensis]MBE9666147.1 D-TA family PLP-dependent enzyme [Mucilaginibacter boryungensis]
MTDTTNWYEFQNTDDLDTPSLLIYPERVISNIQLIKQMIGDVSLLRPHVKTNKSVNVSRLMIDAGINKFKCATIAEAEMLGQAGAVDVLLAYQPGKVKLERLIKLTAAYPRTNYACLVDNITSADMISATALQHKVVMAVYIDLNTGMNRTGIIPAKALELFKHLIRLPGIKFMGLHAYDGHINDVDPAERERICEAEFAPVEKLREAIQALGYPFPLLVAGGSPTFPVHAKRVHTECSPGTFIFWDKNYHDHIAEQGFVFGAIVLTRVISLPDETKICIDLGYKAITCEGDLQHRVYFLNAPHLTPYSHSEEHMVIEAGKDHGYNIGDKLFALPLHICPTVAMYNDACIIEKGVYKDKWAITARGRELSI